VNVIRKPEGNFIEYD